MKLPYEILRSIGLYLNQINQKECCLVCKAWQKPFQTLVFQKAVLLEQRQADLYNEQDALLRKLTTSLHFNITLTDELFEQYAKASPNVNTLTLFVNLLNNLSIPKTVSVIKTYWLKNLIKIRMDELILPEVLPLISQQLEDVTGGFAAFFDENTRELIPMPKLKILDIEQEEEKDYGNLMSVQVLNDMRIAYPQLQDLTISYFFLEPIDDEETFVFMPFSLVRSFHMLNCNDHLNSYRQIKKMFTDLKRFSFLRTDVNDEVKWAQAPYQDLVTAHPNLKELNLLYLHEMSTYDGFPALKTLSKLSSFHLERSIGTDIITKREILDLESLVTSAPYLRKLKVYGLFYVSTHREPFEHYLCGTVGFCDNVSTNKFIRTGENVSSVIHYEEENDIDEFNTFGNGEQLYKGRNHFITVKKKMPRLFFHTEHSDIYEWNETGAIIDRLTEPPALHSFPTTYLITNLHLEWVTLKNPTYLWISRYLPLLEEFQVLNTEPYPFCNIVLGKNIRTFNITFDTRYAKYGTPIIHLRTGNSETNIKWDEDDNQFQVSKVSNDSCAHCLYLLDFTYHLPLVDLTVCGHSLSSVLKKIKFSVNKDDTS